MLLLIMLAFNIAHDSVLAKKAPQGISIQTALMEQSNMMDDNTVSTLHHLFHFIAILSADFTALAIPENYLQSIYKNTSYSPPSQQNSIKPPIA